MKRCVAQHNKLRRSIEEQRQNGQRPACNSNAASSSLHPSDALAPVGPAPFATAAAACRFSSAVPVAPAPYSHAHTAPLKPIAPPRNESTQSSIDTVFSAQSVGDAWTGPSTSGTQGPLRHASAGLLKELISEEEPDPGGDPTLELQEINMQMAVSGCIDRPWPALSL